jgi:hypothetical protein
MTFQEIVDNAKARGLDFSVTYPTTERVLFRRIEIRQREIFSAAARLNPDYFGTSSEGPIDAEFRANLKDLDVAADVDPAANVTRVEIGDPGTHPTLQNGDQVNVVSISDREAELAPRMTLRNFVLEGVGQDLAGVVTIVIFYGYFPETKAVPHDGFEEAELPLAYQELLVFDLTRWLIQQTLEMDPATKTAALEVLGVEAGEMLVAFLAEVGDFAGAQVSRFGDVVGSQRE